MAESSSNKDGITFFGLLGILFIGLKLGGVIDWPWWAVLAPLWGPFAIVFIVFVILCIVGLAK